MLFRLVVQITYQSFSSRMNFLASMGLHKCVAELVTLIIPIGYVHPSVASSDRFACRFDEAAPG